VDTDTSTELLLTNNYGLFGFRLLTRGPKTLRFSLLGRLREFLLKRQGENIPNSGFTVAETG